MRTTRLAALALALPLALLSACGGGGGDDEADGGGARMQAAGDANVDVGDDGGGATTTIPVAESVEGPAIIRLGSAWTAFRRCITDAGFGDEPLPGPEGTEGLDPAYADALGRCNNETGIVAAFQAFQEESANLDPDQIEQQNEGIIAFRECIVRKGWTMGELSPNENGVLFPSGGAPEPPPGRDGTRDYEDCAKVGTERAAEVAEEQAAEAEDNG